MNNFDSVKHMCSLSKDELAKARLRRHFDCVQCLTFLLSFSAGLRSWAASRPPSRITSFTPTSSDASRAEDEPYLPLNARPPFTTHTTPLPVTRPLAVPRYATHCHALSLSLSRSRLPPPDVATGTRVLCQLRRAGFVAVGQTTRSELQPEAPERGSKATGRRPFLRRPRVFKAESSAG